MSGLLLRDLAQVATPVGDGGPLRGRALREVAVHERAYLLIDDDGTITSVGAMRDLPRIGSDVDDLDGSGLSAIPWMPASCWWSLISREACVIQGVSLRGPQTT